MNTDKNIRNTIIDVEDSVLILIDVQDRFLEKYDNARSQSVVEKIIWLIRVANLLDVPIIAMAEDIASMGSITQTVRNALPEESIIYNKDAFGLTRNADILDAVNATGKRIAVLTGMETDVCVAQSALGLVAHGFQVAAVKDAVATTEGDEEIGLLRMRDAGVVITSVKALYFEWLRSVSNIVNVKELEPELEKSFRPNSLKL